MNSRKLAISPDFCSFQWIPTEKSPPKKIEKVLRPAEKDINAWLLSAHGFLSDFAFLAG